MSRFARPIPEAMAPLVELSVDQVEELLGKPPRPDMGQLAFPCFQLAKSLRKAPPAIAEDLAAQLEPTGAIRRITAAGPYVNAFLDGEAVAREVLPAALELGDRFGCLDVGQGRAVTVDYSSPNIAKSFGIHHLRSTVIGHALVNMLAAAGYEPVGINHLGDWGTQFGQLLAIWDQKGDEAQLSERGIAYLLELYIEFNAAKEENPALQDVARAKFKSLEDGDAEARRLWALFRAVSLDEFERVYAMLDIHFDDMRGESFYEDLMPAVLSELEARGLLKESEGATVVDLEPYDLGVALVRKADGSTLYLTRDLASAGFRKDTYDFVRSLYVVGGSQALHFKQMTKVLELMERPWHDAIEHVPFGLMRFKDRKMSTRKGDIVPLRDVLKQAAARAKETILRGAEEKGRPVPDDIDDLAHRIGVGAVVFNDLKNRRVRDVVFDWDEVLAFDGETGPYLQYTAARIASMEARYGKPPTADVDWQLLDGSGELALILALSELPEALQRGLDACEPSLISDKLLEIASLFSTLYSNREWKVLSDDARLTDARMLLAHGVRQALCNGLGWLGIPVPARM
jgi:arginyl-tRNA synthetase